MVTDLVISVDHAAWVDGAEEVHVGPHRRQLHVRRAIHPAAAPNQKGRSANRPFSFNEGSVKLQATEQGTFAA